MLGLVLETQSPGSIYQICLHPLCSLKDMGLSVRIPRSSGLQPCLTATGVNQKPLWQSRCEPLALSLMVRPAPVHFALCGTEAP